MKKISLLLVLLLLPTLGNGQEIRVGAKNFNEGYLLSEIISQLLEDRNLEVQILEDRNLEVQRKFNLGGTLICFEALKNGEIDIYPEYTGTISEQILKSDREYTHAELRRELKNEFNLYISDPYGFNNTYALAMKKGVAGQAGIEKISDLETHADLNFAFSYEFLKRKDGWENLAAAYNLPQRPVGIEHGLAYQAIEGGKIDLIDIYSTDGEIERYNLQILADDRDFFPQYYAVSFFRDTGIPEFVSIIDRLTGSLDEQTMQRLNALVVFENKSYPAVARQFLSERGIISQDVNDTKQVNPIFEIADKTVTHLKITFIALLAAMLLAIPLGIYISSRPRVARPVLYISSLLQTIPSIALLAFMIPLFGIGILPAVVALFLYALLPILRNTTSALFSIDPLLKKVATGIGLNPWQRLRYVEIPLAVPMIFAGIKTAAVINIGTATLAAFIGAGGLGEFIVTGLALNNTAIILRGAIPAALLAILVEFLFEVVEKFFVPAHLQQKLTR